VLEGLQSLLAENGLTCAGMVPGNHDHPEHCFAPGGLRWCPGGTVLGAWTIVHGHDPCPEGPIVQGHEHPCVALGGCARAPCFLVGKDHLVLPAYSCDAAGANVLASRRWRDFSCCAAVEGNLFDLGPVCGLRARLR
jgi:metallophosphoesterase superfamily enzyme